MEGSVLGQGHAPYGDTPMRMLHSETGTQGEHWRWRARPGEYSVRRHAHAHALYREMSTGRALEWLARPRACSIRRHAVATRSIQSRGYRESVGLVC